MCQSTNAQIQDHKHNRSLKHVEVKCQIKLEIKCGNFPININAWQTKLKLLTHPHKNAQTLTISSQVRYLLFDTDVTLHRKDPCCFSQRQEPTQPSRFLLVSLERPVQSDTSLFACGYRMSKEVFFLPTPIRKPPANPSKTGGVSEYGCKTI